MRQKLEFIKTLLGLMVQRAESHAQKDAMIKLVIAYIEQQIDVLYRDEIDSVSPSLVTSPAEVDDIPF